MDDVQWKVCQLVYFCHIYTYTSLAIVYCWQVVCTSLFFLNVHNKMFRAIVAVMIRLDMKHLVHKYLLLSLAISSNIACAPMSTHLSPSSDNSFNAFISIGVHC